MSRSLLIAAAATAGFAVAAGATFASAPPTGWSWLLGRLGDASIGRMSALPALLVGAYYGGQYPIDLSGQKVVIASRAGNFEFEHSLGLPDSTLVAADTSGRPTPIQIGVADGQNITPLIVSGGNGMTPYLQSWQLGGHQLSGIGPTGHLRLNGIALKPVIGQDGSIELQAVLPDGSTQLLVLARSSSSG